MTAGCMGGGGSVAALACWSPFFTSSCEPCARFQRLFYMRQFSKRNDDGVFWD